MIRHSLVALRSMKTWSGILLPALSVAFMGSISTASAQEEEETAPIEEIVVTGSRIRRYPLSQAAPVMNFSESDIDQTGQTNLGAALQQLPITGSAINTRFNVPGNSGFPQDGSGIDAGGVQLSLRNLGAKRTLILIDGKRWVAGASASGVPSTVDLNTLPSNVIQRIEILQDGASAIYGSDAIGGVVNIITNSNFEGFKFELHKGQFISEGDGTDTDMSLLWGGGNDQTHFVFSAAFTEEGGVETSSRPRSAFPNPDATSCNVPGSRCSGYTPQGQFQLGSNFANAGITLNNGVVNGGTPGTLPVFNPGSPATGAFHVFTAADRFNYNGGGFNYLRTPQRTI